MRAFLSRPSARLAGVSALVLGVAAYALVAAHSRAAAGPAMPVPVTAAASPSHATDPATNYRDPAAVCSAFAGALFTADTTVDSGPLAAYRRAGAYADEAYTQALRGAGNDHTAQWQLWVDHRALTQIRVVDANTSAALAAGFAAVFVTVTPLGADGWHATPTTSLVTCTLTGGSTGYRVAGYQVLPQ